MPHLELTIDIEPILPFAEIVTVQLAEIGFDSFVDTDTGIIAYGATNKTSIERILNETILGEQRTDVIINFSSQIIEEQNWNALWESNFEPIFIENKLAILAPFHERKGTQDIIVEIQPQMSFGTGHHPTTYMMAQALLTLNVTPKEILDMGTGTGVLAIIAEKIFPNSRIVAIDIEENAIENAIENIQRNDCKNIQPLLGDLEQIPNKQFDLILANINKNTLKKHIPTYSQQLSSHGVIVISGFFETDTQELYEIANQYALISTKTSVKDSWATIQFMKQ